MNTRDLIKSHMNSTENQINNVEANVNYYLHKWGCSKSDERQVELALCAVFFKGAMHGDEFNHLCEHSPNLMRYLADRFGYATMPHFRIGVRDGQVTGRIVFDVLSEPMIDGE